MTAKKLDVDAVFSTIQCDVCYAPNDLTIGEACAGTVKCERCNNDIEVAQSRYLFEIFSVANQRIEFLEKYADRMTTTLRAVVAAVRCGTNLSTETKEELERIHSELKSNLP